jgi:protein arginine N-methyltransferase 1
MIGDRSRVEAYARAIARSVKLGAAVLEIGTGTGLFAFLACRAGARHVYAIEADDIIEIARQNAAANGLGDRITFFHALSTEVELPEPVDLIVSDLRGVLPPFENHLGSIDDARRRFLAPGGQLIPRGDRILVACVDAAREHAAVAAPWSETVLGVALPAARELVLNDMRKERFDPGQLVTEPACWADIDYTRVESRHLHATVHLRASRSAQAHGIAAWFEADLGEGISYSSAPGASESIYGNAYFPWPRAVPLAAGEEIEVTLDARHAGGDYLWTWETRCATAHFRQSTFHANPMSAAHLRLREAGHTPRIGDEARIDLFILDSMERSMALGEIARDLAARFPVRFPRWEDALARVGDLSVRYGRAGAPGE